MPIVAGGACLKTEQGVELFLLVLLLSNVNTKCTMSASSVDAGV